MSVPLSMTDADKDRFRLAAVPRFLELAEELLAVREKFVLDLSAPLEIDESAGTMALSFFAKQYEHLNSVIVLIEAGCHRDAGAIGRIMVEGMVTLHWAFEDSPARPERWLTFGLVLDYRRMKRFENKGRPLMDRPDKSVLEPYLERFGSIHMSEKILKKVGKAILAGDVPEVPDDPWVRFWTETKPKEMFEALFVEMPLLGEDFYGASYNHPSEWIHWNPRSVISAVADPSIDVGVFSATDAADALTALFNACEAVIYTAAVVAELFGLNVRQILVQFSENIREIKRASEAGGVVT